MNNNTNRRGVLLSKILNMPIKFFKYLEHITQKPSLNIIQNDERAAADIGSPYSGSHITVSDEATAPVSPPPEMIERINRIWHGEPVNGLSGLNRPGYGLPDQESLIWTPLSANVDKKDHSTPIGANWLLSPAGRLPPDCEVAIEPGAVGNILVVGPDSAVHGRVWFQSTDGVVLLSGQSSWSVCRADIRLSSPMEGFFLGRDAKSNGLTAIVEGEGTAVQIGDDCMIAPEVIILTSDLHSIVDLETGAWINQQATVTVEPHVWLGRRAMILRGSSIGYGAIIGAGALVKGTIPRYVIAAGVPARVTRQNVSWDSARIPNPNVANQVLEGGRRIVTDAT